MSTKLPIVAIVGRANVGKSSLFNAILDRREAIVALEAGTTRDSITAKAEWKDHNFWLVDTAGMKDATDDFEFTIQEQIIQAADSADIIWVVVEANVPVNEEDRRVAKLALKSKKPVFLIINKVDRARGGDLEGFERLGIKPIFPTSATQKRGIDTLLDTLISQIPHATLVEDSSRLRIALLGRPNVGKSQLFNTLAKKQQAIVADRAGTTRDINRTTVKYIGQEIELMDTAGIRRPGKIGVGIEHFSVIRTLSAIEQADVCLLLIDVNELSTALDQKIAGMIKEAGKGLIIVVSKWDSVEGKDAFTRDALAPQIAHAFDFVAWAPLVFTSSVTGQNVTKIFDLALQVAEHRKTRIPTSQLNNWLASVISKHPPAGLKNRAPKLNYMVQEDDNPTPAFKIFGAHTKFLHWSYRRYMERDLRTQWNFDGTAIQLWFIEKDGRHKHGNSPTKPERSTTQRKIVKNKARSKRKES
ncbi:ribosome biogenesis GTPase Der [Candidatus Saccharibacteria bacterium]|nr:MAG: ribosome biogenesis GTPase Der [Candidatus Saccharibacteria bacterium]